MQITANALQTVAVNQNVIFTDTSVKGSCSIVHADGSGLTTLRGITNQCRARFLITFSANAALPTDATVESVTLAIAVNGEAIGPGTMIVSPTAVEEFWNVSKSILVDVPAGCCVSVSVKNIGLTEADVQNANLIVERVA